MLLRLAATLAICSADWSPEITSYPISVDGDSAGGFAAEFWGNLAGIQTTDADRKLTVQGNNRLYAVTSIPSRPKAEWVDFTYRKLDLLNRDLSFDVDISGVGCGCNAAVYLVAMPNQPDATNAAYCDIQGPDGKACLEIDLLEGNTKAVQTTLHTAQGHGADGATCNQDGCVANVGRTEESAHLYGPGSKGIDSRKPFTVSATFREGQHGGAIYDVEFTQSIKTGPPGRETITDGRLHFFDSEAIYGSHSKSGRAAPVPPGDKLRTHTALSDGMVLVVSLWTADDLSWLDGGCDATHPKCSIETARFEVSNLRVSSVPSPPSPPPIPPPLTPPNAPPAIYTDLPKLLLLVSALLLVLCAVVAGRWYVSQHEREVESAEDYGKKDRRGRRTARRQGNRQMIEPVVEEDDDDDDEMEDAPVGRARGRPRL